MSVRGTSVLAGDVDELDQTPGLGEALQVLTTTTATGKEPTAHLTQLDAELDLTDPSNRAAFDAFMLSAGKTLLPGSPPTRIVDGARTAAAGNRLYERFRDDGAISVLNFDRNGTEYGGGLNVQLEAKGGAEASLAFTDAELQSARYFDNSAGRFRPWTSCLG